MDMLRNELMVLRMIGVHDRHGIGKKNVEERRLLKFCDEKELCEANTWFEKKVQRKTAYIMGGNKI